MSYTDLGFDNFFSRELVPQTESNKTEFDFASEVQGLSLDQVRGGAMRSSTGRMVVNLEDETMTISDGSIDRVVLGKIEDGTYGLIIRDNVGTELMRIGNINLIQSPSGNLQLDFDEERILVKDQGGTPRVLIGKGDF